MSDQIIMYNKSLISDITVYNLVFSELIRTEKFELSEIDEVILEEGNEIPDVKEEILEEKEEVNDKVSESKSSITKKIVILPYPIN